MNVKLEKQIFSEKEIQRRLENGKRISKAEFVKKFTASKIVTK